LAQVNLIVNITDSLCCIAWEQAATDLKVAALRSQSAQQSEEQRVLMQLLGDTESLLALVSQSPPNIDPIQEADRADMALDVFLLSKQVPHSAFG
jgi:hypothetical protein